MTTFTVQLPNIASSRVVAVYLNSKPGMFRFDSVRSQTEGNLFTLMKKDADKGSIIFTAASFDSTLEKKGIENALSITLFTDQKLVEEPVELTARYYDNKGALMHTAFGTVKLNWRSVVPEPFEMTQNYPNPFDPSTTIEYQLPKDSRISLKVYNVLGQEVAELFTGDQKAGYYTTSWDARNMASGVYIYRLYSKDFVHSKKMLLMR